MAQVAMLLWGAYASPTQQVALLSVPLSAALLLLSLVDAATMRLPDLVTLPLTVGGIAIAALEPGGWSDRLIGAGVGYGVFALIAVGFRRLRGREGLGLGDAKLLAAAGAWLGWRPLPWTVMAACAFGFVWVGVRWAFSGRRSLTQPLPFGVPLAAAIWITWLYGAPGV